jgi:hypothetical protein
MYLYEAILNIIEQYGPVDITFLTEEINRQNLYKRMVKVQETKSVISREKEIFHKEGKTISLNDDYQFVYLEAWVGGYPGPSYEVKVDFMKNTFTYHAWKNFSEIPDEIISGSEDEAVKRFGNDLRRIQLHNWKTRYEPEGLILDGTSWRVKLVTHSSVLESSGHNSFPTKWSHFCKSIEKLTGKTFR